MAVEGNICDGRNFKPQLDQVTKSKHYWLLQDTI
jgi:hypothetical protein